jgi:hypothetical protein
MSPSATVTIEKEPRVEKEANHTRRRGKLPGMARKASQTLKQLEEMAVQEEEQNLADHERVSVLANRATGGSFSAILKNSPLLNGEEKAFLKELGYI